MRSVWRALESGSTVIDAAAVADVAVVVGMLGTAAAVVVLVVAVAVAVAVEAGVVVVVDDKLSSTGFPIQCKTQSGSSL